MNHSRTLPSPSASPERIEHQRGNPFRIATYILAVALIIAGGATIGISVLLSVCFCVMLCGWCEVNGLCGQSHVGTLTPIVVLGRAPWRKAVGAYTAAGLLSSACVGSVLGGIGNLVNGDNDVWGFLAAALLAIVLAGREIGLVSFPLPQIRRQTHKMWARDFGFVPAAAMWGAHIGLGVATVIKHGGLFVVIALTLAGGSLYGIALFGAFWVGRVLPLWLAPSLVSTPGNGIALLRQVCDPEPCYRWAAAIGLLSASAALFVHVSQIV